MILLLQIYISPFLLSTNQNFSLENTDFSDQQTLAEHKTDNQCKIVYHNNPELKKSATQEF